jgi:hypothetical protein
MAALLQQMALVSESDDVPLGDVMKVAAALQKQASRDIAPMWDISATLDAFETLEDVPLGYWPMIVKDNIGYDAMGIHLDKDNQPFALISSADTVDGWSLTASHEMCEMLIDPFGNRLVAGDSPKKGQSRVDFLVEVCDPSEAAEFGYSANGILVSDFYTPKFFDPLNSPGIRYSFTGAITKPRQVLRGGYLSWYDPITDHWWQETWFGGAKSKFVDLGQLDAKAGSIRAQIDRLTGQATAKAMAGGRSTAKSAGLTSAVVRKSTVSRASHWREEIDALLRQSAGASGSARVYAGTKPQGRAGIA